MPAFMVLFVRRYVDEPHLFKAAREKIATGPHRQIWLEIFSPEIIKSTILTSLLTTGAQGGYYALFTWLPTYLKAERKLSVIGSGGYIAVVIIGSFIGLLVGAHLADRIGRRANFPLFAVCSPITVVVYTQLAVDDGLIAWISTRLLRHRHLRRYGCVSD